MLWKKHFLYIATSNSYLLHRSIKQICIMDHLLLQSWQVSHPSLPLNCFQPSAVTTVIGTTARPVEQQRSSSVFTGSFQRSGCLCTGMWHGRSNRNVGSLFRNMLQIEWSGLFNYVIQHIQETQQWSLFCCWCTRLKILVQYLYQEGSGTH